MHISETISSGRAIRQAMIGMVLQEGSTKVLTVAETDAIIAQATSDVAFKFAWKAKTYPLLFYEL